MRPQEGALHSHSSSSTEPVRSNAADTQLAWRLRGDDADALQVIADRHWPTLVRYASQFCDSADQSNDVAQEALVQLWQNRLKLQGGSSIRAYLLRTVRNIGLNEIRARGVRTRASTIASVQEHLYEAKQLLPDGELERQERAAALRAALLRLPTRRREALMLIRFSGLSYREAAEVMGTSPQTVANQVTRALQDLRQLLVASALDNAI